MKKNFPKYQKKKIMMVARILDFNTERVRACIKCKEYVVIKPNDPSNINLLKEFEKLHRLHMVITINNDEINGEYKEMEFQSSETS